MSIKQNWDKPNFGMNNFTAKNSDMKNLSRTRQNPSSELTSRKSTNQRIKGKHNIDTSLKFMGGTNDIMSPEKNMLETVESPNSRDHKASDYYGTYAKV